MSSCHVQTRSFAAAEKRRCLSVRHGVKLVGRSSLVFSEVVRRLVCVLCRLGGFPAKNEASIRWKISYNFPPELVLYWYPMAPSEQTQDIHLVLKRWVGVVLRTIWNWPQNEIFGQIYSHCVAGEIQLSQSATGWGTCDVCYMWVRFPCWMLWYKLSTQIKNGVNGILIKFESSATLSINLLYDTLAWYYCHTKF